MNAFDSDLVKAASGIAADLCKQHLGAVEAQVASVRGEQRAVAERIARMEKSDAEGRAAVLARRRRL
ncbi:hypothetical protein [Sinomonas soli]